MSDVPTRADGPATATTPSGATVFTGIRTVSVLVEDLDAALRFYTEVLGFTVLRDMPIPTGRWIELSPGDPEALGGDHAVVTLHPAPPGVVRGPIMIRFTAEDAAFARQSLVAAGVDVDELLTWPGVPPMFSFRDPDGNTFSITET